VSRAHGIKVALYSTPLISHILGQENEIFEARSGGYRPTLQVRSARCFPQYSTRKTKAEILPASQPFSDEFLQLHRQTIYSWQGRFHSSTEAIGRLKIYGSTSTWFDPFPAKFDVFRTPFPILVDSNVVFALPDATRWRLLTLNPGRWSICRWRLLFGRGLFSCSREECLTPLEKLRARSGTSMI